MTQFGGILKSQKTKTTLRNTTWITLDHSQVDFKQIYQAKYWQNVQCILAQSSAWGPEALCLWLSGTTRKWRREISQTSWQWNFTNCLVPESVGENLMEPTIKLKNHRNSRVDRIKVKTLDGTWNFYICPVENSWICFTKFIIEMDIVSGWGVLPLRFIIKQKAHNTTVQQYWTQYMGMHRNARAHTIQNRSGMLVQTQFSVQ